MANMKGKGYSFDNQRTMKAYSGKSAGKQVSLSVGLTEDDLYCIMDVKENNAEKIQSLFRAALMRALEEIGLVAEGYAKRLCPVDTGRLRNSITHQIKGSDVYIGTNVEYAPVIEFGRKKGKYRGANGGKGFLRPAAIEHKDVYEAILLKHLSK